ncbi:MAG TPA: DinB family protein [Gemmatimonadales bacterium]|nr:DinB family protein [Gemmatimonadales bacterium]
MAEERVFRSWLDYQTALRRALLSLTADQLRHRPLPGRRTPGELAEHIVYARALHLHRALGEAAQSVTPFLSWETANGSRSAGEIVHGLDVTWQVIADFVSRGTPTTDLPKESALRSMQGVWGLLDHDLPHAGQLSLLLRASGLPGVDI